MKSTPDDIGQIIGKISPPPGTIGLNGVDPAAGLSNLLVVSIRLFFFFVGIALLIYLLWGAFDWVISEGDKEKLGKAQAKMTQAVVGIIITIFAIAIFAVLTGSVLGIIDFAGGGFKFSIPHL